ncbi:MAG: hypothetical protein Q7N50_12455 [Armatimonadota bacterium]|nr:hypothetical protein [Armatimonadota bacterium]
MHIPRIVLLAGIILTTFLVINEVLSWRRNSSLSSRQRFIRVSSGITLICLLGLVLAGNILGILFTANTEEALRHPILALVFGFIAIALAFILVALALLDIREVLETYKRKRREMRTDMRGKDGRLQ